MNLVVGSLGIFLLALLYVLTRRRVSRLEGLVEKLLDWKPRAVYGFGVLTQLQKTDRATVTKLRRDIDRIFGEFDLLAGKVRELTPDAILGALAQKERFLDQANTRIDNGIATARNLGETAGDNAARAMIRDCIERAAAGKGPPLSILPPNYQVIHISDKILRTHLEEERKRTAEKSTDNPKIEGCPS